MSSSAEQAEAQRILDALNNLIHHAGEAYVGLAGQTAAVQAVVADLRRCDSFLQTRLVGQPPSYPWLQPATTTRGGPPSSSSTAAANASVGSFRSPSPTPPDRPGTPSYPAPPSGPECYPTDPRTPTQPQAQAQPPSGSRPSPTLTSPHATPGSAPTRPPLAGGSASRLTGGRGSHHHPASSRSTPAQMPAAGRPSAASSGASGGRCRSRDASPQRRGGGVSGGMAGTPSAPGSSHPPRSTPQAAAAAATTGVIQPAAENGMAPPSHLPLAAQRALSAAASLASSGPMDGVYQPYHHPGQQQQQQDVAPKPAGPPHLPLALRRAMQRYRETLQTRDVLLRQREGREGASPCAGGGASSLADTVAAAGRTYQSALARHYKAAQAVLNGQNNNTSKAQAVTAKADAQIAVAAAGAAAQMQRMSLVSGIGGTLTVTELRRKVQVAFAALVAAQTWLIQNLGELARTRGSGGGGGGSVAAAGRLTALADTCASLLKEVEELRVELRQLQQQLGSLEGAPDAAAAVPVALNSVASNSQSPACWRFGGAGGGSTQVEARARQAAVEALGMDEEFCEAAALWRNRFLRAVLGDAGVLEQQQGSGGRGRRGGHGTMSRGAGAGGRPQQQHQQQQHGAPRGLSYGVTLSIDRMPQPLGVWLPDAMWMHAPATAAANAEQPAMAPSPARVAPGGSMAPPWHVLLPAYSSMSTGRDLSEAGAWQHSVRTAGGVGGSAGAVAPPALLCASAQEAVAHGRAQLQLQATLFQLVLEGSLAAPLLPRQRPPPASHGAIGFGSGRGVAAQAAHAAWERWLAQCRLAHLMLFKGAWNRLCSVVELAEEEEVVQDE